MKEGNHWVWFNAMAVALSLVAVIGIIGFMVIKGMAHFWPKDINVYTVQDGQGSTVQLIGELHRTGERAEVDPKTGVTQVHQLLVKTGNRDLLGSDFKWEDEHDVVSSTQPSDIVSVERYEWGNLYGTLKRLTLSDGRQIEGTQMWATFQDLIEHHSDLHDEIVDIQKGRIGQINYEVEQLRLDRRRL
jgi:phosphate transport system permease protein